MNIGTIRDWKFFCTEANFCEVQLYGNVCGEIIFTGTLSGIPSCYDNYTVQSFDPVDKDYPYLVLNINE